MAFFAKVATIAAHSGLPREVEGSTQSHNGRRNVIDRSPNSGAASKTSPRERIEREDQRQKENSVEAPGAQPRQTNAREADGEAAVAARAPEENESVRAAAREHKYPSASSMVSLVSRRLSESRTGRPESDSGAVLLNRINAPVGARAGQLSLGRRPTPVATPGSRIEVRGELEVTNVSSAQELVNLLEDNSSPFALQLQNVELRVNPGQTVRLGEAVPALREHLRREVHRQLHQEASPQGSVSLSGNTHRSSSILLTGTVRGTVKPTLFGSEVGRVTARTSAPQPHQVVMRRTQTLVRRESSMTYRAPTAAAKSSAAAADRSCKQDSAAQVPTALRAQVTEQIQQQRASSDASSLVQQILEVQGQVKSLLAEEGLSVVAEEPVAVKKKKGAHEVEKGEERHAPIMSGNGTPETTGANSGTKSEPQISRCLSKDSSRDYRFSKSGSSSSRMFAKNRAVSKVAQSVASRDEPQHVATGVELEGTSAGKETVANDPMSVEMDRHEDAESATDRAPKSESTKAVLPAETRETAKEEEKRRTEGAHEVRQKGKEPRGLSDRKGSTLGESTHRTQKQNKMAAETSAEKLAEAARAGRVEEATNREEGALYVPSPGRFDAENDGEHTSEKVNRTTSIQKAHEVHKEAFAETRRSDTFGTQEERGTDLDAEAIETLSPRGSETPWKPELVVATRDTPANHRKFSGSGGSAAETGGPPTRISSAKGLPQDGELTIKEGKLPFVEARIDLEKSTGREVHTVKAKEEVKCPPVESRVSVERAVKEELSRVGTDQRHFVESKKPKLHGSGTEKPPPTNKGDVHPSETVLASPEPTLIQTLSRYLSWEAAEEKAKPSATLKDVRRAAETRIHVKKEEQTESVNESARGLDGQMPPAQQTAEPEGKEKHLIRKAQPKLKPKAPPARALLPKRDAE